MAQGHDQQQPDDPDRITNPLAEALGDESDADGGDTTPRAEAPDERKWNETGGTPESLAARADEEHCEAPSPRRCRSRHRLPFPSL